MLMPLQGKTLVQQGSLLLEDSTGELQEHHHDPFGSKVLHPSTPCLRQGRVEVLCSNRIWGKSDRKGRCTSRLLERECILGYKGNWPHYNSTSTARHNHRRGSARSIPSHSRRDQVCSIHDGFRHQCSPSPCSGY